MSLRDWWRSRKARRDLERFNQGFDYVAGQLLRGEIEPQCVYQYVAESDDFGNRDHFDEGCEYAADLWRARMRTLT